MKLLLLSNSTLPGRPYLEWPLDHIDNFLGEVREALFIPYAAVGFGYDEYEAMVKKALAARGIEVVSIHHSSDPVESVSVAKAILVGGGNTFHLNHCLHENNLMEAIQKRVRYDVPYIGWSAGSNVACPTIKTTNDMPVIQPKSFDSINLVDFQINAHYTEKTIEGHGGESRMQRLKEYIAINQTPVVCLPEGCAIKIQGEEHELISDEPIKVLYQDGVVKTLQPGIVQL